MMTRRSRSELLPFVGGMDEKRAAVVAVVKMWKEGVNMVVHHWKKTLHRCPNCPAVGIVVGSDDRPGEWNILWAFPEPRDVIGGPSEVAHEGSVNDYTLSRPDFGCGYCEATLRPGSLHVFLGGRP